MKLKIFLPLCACALTFAVAGCAQKSAAPGMVSVIHDDELLEEAREAVDAQDPRIMPAFDSLVSLGEKYLAMDPLSVTMKKKLPPSNDPRDFMTLSPYWWPDPSAPDGLPYIRRDGERNPQVYDYPERVNSSVTGDAAETLAMLYYLTGNEKYAAKAAELIRTWFLDPEKGINPNMTFAQHVPGMKTLRGTGIIDTRRYIVALDAAKMIEGSESWTPGDCDGLRQWSSAMLYWLTNSTQGRKELRAGNNHGLWYETIRLICAVYAGEYEFARHLLEESLAPRIGVQVAADGSLPRELERTLGLHYSTFALEAIATADIIGRKLGVDLWNYRAPNGRTPGQALDFLLPYYETPEQWPYMQIKPFEQERAALLLDQAGKAMANEGYMDMARRIGYRSRGEGNVINSLLYYELQPGE